VQLTVPEQFVSAISVGAPVTFEVDAYPGRSFTGTVRYVSPSLEAAQRALTVEATVPNPAQELKPGLFATARIDQRKPTPAVVVPAKAVHTVGGTSRVFVISNGRAEERVVTIGQTSGDVVEIATGLKAGEQVATTNVAQLSDGARCLIMQWLAALSVKPVFATVLILAHGRRRVLLLAARRRPLPQSGHPHDYRDDRSARRRAGADRD
jgi:RND family efflux transporter MFP subunit